MYSISFIRHCFIKSRKVVQQQGWCFCFRQSIDQLICTLLTLMEYIYIRQFLQKIDPLAIYVKHDSSIRGKTRCIILKSNKVCIRENKFFANVSFNVNVTVNRYKRKQTNLQQMHHFGRYICVIMWQQLQQWVYTFQFYQQGVLVRHCCNCTQLLEL